MAAVVQQMAIETPSTAISTTISTTSTTGCVLRLLEASDLSELCRLLGQLSTVGDVSEAALRRFYAAVAENARHVVVVVEERSGSGVLVGTATLLVEPKLLRGGSFVGHVEDVVVDQKYRGAGLGKLLVTHLVLKAREAGCYKVILDCADENVGFYEKCGLEKHGNCMAVYF